MPSWLSSASSNLLLSLQGVQQPCEDPSVDSSLNYRTQRVLFSCACLHTYSMPSWQSIFSQNVQQFCSLFVSSFHSLNAHLAELSESSVILFLLELLNKVLLCAFLAPARCPLGRASQNSSELLSAIVYLLHNLAS
jgi:hypothetical protein